MKLTPIKKIIIALIVMVVVVSVVTANNLTSIMMIKAAMNAQENIPTEYSTYYYKETASDSQNSAAAPSGSSGSGTAATTAASGSASSGSTTAASGSTGSDATTAPSGDKVDTPAAGAKPESKAEIIEYFNKSSNAVKTNAKVVKQQSVTIYLSGATKIGDGLSGIYNILGGDEWLDGMLQGNSQGAADYSGADITAKYPVEGQTWSSKLTEADVSSATCTEANGVYTIEITTIDDAASANHVTGEGHAPKAFNVVLPGVVNDNIPGIAQSIVGQCEMAYPASTVKVTIDAATGNVLTAEYDLKWTIVFGSMDTELPFGTKAIYNIEW